MPEDFHVRRGPEAQLLLCCARLVLGPAHRERFLRLLEDTLDWSRVMRLAERHGLRPLLYKHLSETAPEAVPRAIFVELWGCHEMRSRRNAAMTKELLRILQLLETEEIAAIPYKGPALAASTYGDIALREFSDLDILLRPSDVLRAKEVLCAHGYRPGYVLAPAVEAAFLRSRAQYHLVLIHAESAVMVELHWKTDPDFPVEPIDDPDWWAGLESADLAGASVRRFAARELLLILCLHGAKHLWASLGWLVDVAELIHQHPRLDWEWIARQAKKLACERRLAIGLYLAHHLLQAPATDEMRALFRGKPEVAALAQQMAAALFEPEFHEMTPLALLRFNLELYERPGQKLAHCLNTFVSPSLVEWSRWPLPRSLFILYPPLRLARLSGKHLFKLVAKV